MYMYIYMYTYMVACINIAHTRTHTHTHIHTDTHTHLVGPAKHLHKGGRLLDGLVPQQYPHSDHGHRAAAVVGHLNGETAALCAHNVETVQVETLLQLSSVVHMKHVRTAKLGGGGRRGGRRFGSVELSRS